MPAYLGQRKSLSDSTQKKPAGTKNPAPLICIVLVNINDCAPESSLHVPGCVISSMRSPWTSLKQSDFILNMSAHWIDQRTAGEQLCCRAEPLSSKKLKDCDSKEGEGDFDDSTGNDNLLSGKLQTHLSALGGAQVPKSVHVRVGVQGANGPGRHVSSVLRAA